jgi:hypothetical protein
VCVPNGPNHNSRNGVSGPSLYEWPTTRSPRGRCLPQRRLCIRNTEKMSVNVHSAADDEGTNASRIAIANQVIDYIGPSLPDLRLVVLLDGWDWYELKDGAEENRGVFYPVNNATYGETNWPFHLREYLISVDDTWKPSFTCDAAVYLHNSTCQTPESQAMTLAHELQHAVQYGRNRTVWAYNTLVTNLPNEWIQALKLQWRDIPIEREARIVAKRACEKLMGRGATAAYIEDRLKSGTVGRDIEDWRFIQSIDTDSESAYDTSAETGRLFRHIESTRNELEKTLADLRKYPEFVDLKIDEAFRLP